MHRLAGSIRHYDWGSTTALAEFRGIEPTGRPEAELWFDDRPELPFLVKILAAASPLSLQVHPDAEAARMGFAAEEAAGMSPGDAHRSFHDDQAKPELVCALSAFEVLCGFRPVADALDIAKALGMPDRFCADLSVRGPVAWPAVVKSALDNPPVLQVQELVGVCQELNEGPRAETAALVARLADLYPSDPALLLVPFLNHHRLEPGEAISVIAGVPHAYLSGMALEVMPFGDNVLRGGFTSKHVDGVGFVGVLNPRAPQVAVQRPEQTVHTYEGPTDEIAVLRLVGAELSTTLADDRHRLVVCVAGSTTVRASTGMVLTPGEALEIPSGGGHLSIAVTGEAYLVTGAPR
ncbi:MAG: mannose-6-phosphate isomerase, class I [Actinomycetota bacterium]|nr:mannose-6-phosphate isomerase, class I [Actinomycetota bacterium]